MAKLVEADEHVTLARQMEEVDFRGPIILINRFTVNLEDDSKVRKRITLAHTRVYQENFDGALCHSLVTNLIHDTLKDLEEHRQ